VFPRADHALYAREIRLCDALSRRISTVGCDARSFAFAKSSQAERLVLTKTPRGLRRQRGALSQ
jgi:hypothetical protein